MWAPWDACTGGHNTGLRGPFSPFGLRTPKSVGNSPTSPAWTARPPPSPTLDVGALLGSWDLPSVYQVFWVGRGAIARVDLWSGDATRAVFAGPPKTTRAPSPSPSTGYSCPPSPIPENCRCRRPRSTLQVAPGWRRWWGSACSSTSSTGRCLGRSRRRGRHGHSRVYASTRCAPGRVPADVQQHVKW